MPALFAITNFLLFLCTNLLLLTLTFLYFSLLLYRMGSFNSAPKINNSDSQDDSLEIPKGLSTPELLQHCKHLRGENQPPLLTRFFLKPLTTLSSQMVSSDVTDGLRCLKLDAVSRGKFYVNV